MSAEILMMGLIVTSFAVFFFTLMAVWIWTKGWAPRDTVAPVSDASEPYALDKAA